MHHQLSRPNPQLPCFFYCWEILYSCLLFFLVFMYTLITLPSVFHGFLFAFPADHFQLLVCRPLPQLFRLPLPASLLPNPQLFPLPVCFLSSFSSWPCPTWGFPSWSGPTPLLYSLFQLLKALPSWSTTMHHQILRLRVCCPTLL